MINLKHNLKMSPRRHVGMLLPFGLHLNRDLIVYIDGRPFPNDELVGQVVKFYDGKGVVKAISIVNLVSTFGESLCKMLYGMSAGKLREVLYGNWGELMEKNLFVFLVVDPRQDIVREVEGTNPLFHLTPAQRRKVDKEEEDMLIDGEGDSTVLEEEIYGADY